VFNKSLILIVVVVVVGYGRVEIEITDGESAEFSRKKERMLIEKKTKDIF